jgi:hypothetical protein
MPDDIGAEAVDGGGPEDEAVLIESVGRALLVVLDRLGPAERIAFVLHDMFAVPFDEIAPIVDRTPVATKKLASRARLRVRGNPVVPGPELDRHREVVEAFLAAARGGDLDALLGVLAPGVVRRSDPAAVPPGAAAEARGARTVARETVILAGRAQAAALALVNGTGSYLRERFGARYVSICLTFHHGAAPYPIPSPPPDFADATLGSADLDGYLLDLHTEAPASVRAWLDAPTRTRMIGPAYDPADNDAYRLSGGSLANWFDAIIHTQVVTPVGVIGRPSD